MSDIAVMQAPYPGECARRVRFDFIGAGMVHVIIEEEDHARGRLFEDERARVTVPLVELRAALHPQPTENEERDNG